MTETYENKEWPEATTEDARYVVVEAALHMTEWRDGAAGVTVARGQFSAKWTVLDQFGQRPDEEPFIVLEHRPTREIIGYYKTAWPHELEEIEEPDLDDVFVQPVVLPGTRSVDE
jgi:hypothetical protein